MRTKAILFTISCSFLFSMAAFGAAQLPEDQNYVKTRTYSAPRGQTYVDDIDYYDGLGKLRQSNSKNATAGSRDLVTMTEYDELGRHTRAWLPTPVAANGNYVLPATLQSVARSYAGYDDNVPFISYFYENASSQRLLEERPAGADFQVSEAVTTLGYFLNDLSDSLSCWKIELENVSASTSAVVCRGMAPINTLFVIRLSGPDNTVSYEFKNARGQLILSRQEADEASFVDTYHVYDAGGNLCYVLPPMLSASITSGTQPSSEQMDRYAYMYDYDSRNRCIGKKLPGKEWEWMIYDKADRLVMSQDGNLREEDRWHYNVYDNLNRLVSTSLIEQQKTSLTRQDIQHRYNAPGFDNSYPTLGGSPDPYCPFADSAFALIALLSESQYGTNEIDIPEQDATPGIIISEIFYDTPLEQQHNVLYGSYGNGEFVELYNCSPTTIDLSNWRLFNNAKTFFFPSGTEIPSGGYLIVAYRTGGSTFTLDQLFDGVGELSAQKQIIYQQQLLLGSQGGSLVLYNEKSKINDALNYGRPATEANPNPIHALNTQGTPGSDCVSIQRIVAELKEDNSLTMGNISHWTVGPVTVFAQQPNFSSNGLPGKDTSVPNYLSPETVAGIMVVEEHIDSRTTGLKTYDKIAVVTDNIFANPSFVERAYYYDSKGRIVQTVEKNHLGGISRTSFNYDFLGNVLAKSESHQPSTHASPDVLTTYYTYDHRGRLLSDITILNSGDPVTVNYSYDDLGRLSGKSLGPAIVESYSYNIQGWQTDHNITQAGEPLYHSQLRYFNPRHNRRTPYYSGNIAEWEWQHAGADLNTYVYEYDNLSRLQFGIQFVNNIRKDDHEEKEITYDANGNILSLYRTYPDRAEISDYTYSGNQLTELDVSIRGVVQNYTYDYDANGNMTRDGANELDITYNHLNLIQKVEQPDGDIVNYSYLSDGTKLSGTNGTSYGLAYIGSLVYEKRNGNYMIADAPFSAGRFLVYSSDTPLALYYIQDHLGSVRAVVEGQAGTVVEQNDYYPFGLRWDNQNSNISGFNRYRYNGKEEQEIFSVPYIDYGARMYDPKYRLGWNGIDPLAEGYYPHGPNTFAGNNPIRNVDMNGMNWYTYEHKYTDRNGVERTETRTKYVHGRMSQQEMKDKGYTDMGRTAIKGNTYYSLFGAELEMDQYGLDGVDQAQSVMLADLIITNLLEGGKINGDFWKKLNELIGTGSSVATIISDFADASKGFTSAVKKVGWLSAATTSAQAYISYQSGESIGLSLTDTAVSIFSLFGVPGATVGIYYHGAKNIAEGGAKLEGELRARSRSLREQIIRMMNGYF